MQKIWLLFRLMPLIILALPAGNSFYSPQAAKAKTMVPIVMAPYFGSWLCSYAITNRIFDIWVMVGFGIVGYILRQMKYPMAPLVLGIILGDILDKNLRRGLVLTDGDLTPFFTRPICLALWLVTISSILMSIEPVRNALQRAVRMVWPGGRAIYPRGHRG